MKRTGMLLDIAAPLLRFPVKCAMLSVVSKIGVLSLSAHRRFILSLFSKEVKGYLRESRKYPFNMWKSPAGFSPRRGKFRPKAGIFRLRAGDYTGQEPPLGQARQRCCRAY